MEVTKTQYTLKKCANLMNRFAIPLIIQYISTYIINLTDQAIVGRISTEAYGVIGICNSFNSMIVGIIGSTALAFNIRAGNRLSKDKKDEFVQEFVSAIFLSFCLGLFFLIIVNAARGFILHNIYSLSGNELNIGLKYFAVVSPYILLQMLLFTYGNLFKILNKTNWLLIGSTVSALLNVLLDYIFVFGKFGFPTMGAEGAAMATIFSMAVNLIILVICSRGIAKIQLDLWIVYIKNSVNQFIESIPMMGQELLEGSVFTLIINSMISRLGILEVSSYLILQQILKFLLVPMNMYGSAVLTLTGQNKYRGIGNLKMIPLIGSYIASGLYIFFAFIAILFRSKLPAIITDDMQVIELSSCLIPAMIICNLANPAYTMFKNALIAIGESKYVLYKSALINVFVVVVTMVLVFLLDLSLTGVLVSTLINSVLLLTIFYRKYKDAIRKIEIL